MSTPPAIVLHHYETSPFSELVRLALGRKGLAWGSVIIPNMAPKPELTPLTGGYRKTPVLQVGADIYCDSAMALDAIEALRPDPTLFPAPLGRLHRMLGVPAGGPLFFATVGQAIAAFPADALPDAWWDDRRGLFGFTRDRVLTGGAHASGQYAAAFAWVADALADGRLFVGGAEPGSADFALYMNVWFGRLFRNATALAHEAAHPAIGRWADRVAAIGHGAPTPMDAADALAIARDADPTALPGVEPGHGFEAGQPVTVRTLDPGADPVAGTLHALDEHAIVILRDDPAVGRVAVHFPRFDQLLSAA